MSAGVLLNPAQQAAVDHRGGPLLVLAGAGTGKTRVITHRVAALLDEGVPPWRILAVTFTNRAALEMRQRIAAIAGGFHDVEELWVGTFHAICARILRRWGRPVGLSRGFSIYDSADQVAVMRRVLGDLKIASDALAPKAVLGYLDRLRNRGQGPQAIDSLGLEEPVRRWALAAMIAYERQVRASDAADFSDLLVLAVRLLKLAEGHRLPPRPAKRRLVARPVGSGEGAQNAQNTQNAQGAQNAQVPLSDFAQELAGLIDFAGAPPEPEPARGRGGQLDDLLALADAGGDDPVAADLSSVAQLRRRFLHVVVDEFQDTNPVQAELITLLAGRAELMVVGDDDQAIYGWRGADVQQILGFPGRHHGCEVIRLEENYRSTTRILDGANAIIRHNSGRFGKSLRSELGEGEPIRVLATADSDDEARWVARMIAADLAAGVEPAEIAVFYRTHALSRGIEEALRRAEVDYGIHGGLRFFDRREIKDLLAYLRLIINPHSDVDLLRVLNVPARKIGKTTEARILEIAQARSLTLYDALTAETLAAAGLGAAAVRRVLGFRGLLDALRGEFSRVRDGEGEGEGEELVDLGALAQAILERTGYRGVLAQDESPESEARLENLQEFVGELTYFSAENPEASLADYLERVALLGDADGDGRSDGGDDDDDGGERRRPPRVTLMTIHSAKGLEFSHVYLTGMEERIFPHARVLDDPGQLEEERRLAYVAVTRAKRRLTITWARQRRLYGQILVGTPSRYLRVLPPEVTVREPAPAAGPGGRATRAGSGPGRGQRAAAPAWSLAGFDAPPEPPPEPPTWDQDIVYDAAAGSGSSSGGDEGVSIYIGMQVRHPRFGVGEVLGWSGVGADLKLELRFADRSTRTILARFCVPT